MLVGGGKIAPVIAACYYKKSEYNFLFAPLHSSHRQPAVLIEYEEDSSHPLTTNPL